MKSWFNCLLWWKDSLISSAPMPHVASWLFLPAHWHLLWLILVWCLLVKDKNTLACTLMNSDFFLGLPFNMLALVLHTVYLCIRIIATYYEQKHFFPSASANSNSVQSTNNYPVLLYSIFGSDATTNTINLISELIPFLLLIALPASRNTRLIHKDQLLLFLLNGDVTATMSF